jgi:CRISPR-associated protein Cas5d
MINSKLHLRVWGERACFTRPEMKVERVSYDVMTPSAARGILEAIHWKPAIRWKVDAIEVLKPIRFESIRRNEVASKIPTHNVSSAMRSGDREGLRLLVDDDRQQRAAMVLRDVAYVIHAHFEMTPKAAGDDNPQKHFEMFTRRAEKGQCFHRPCLGCREFAADFALDDGVREKLPDTLRGQKELGWMLDDIDFANGMTPKFFLVCMVDGFIDVAACRVGRAAR